MYPVYTHTHTHTLTLLIFSPEVFHNSGQLHCDGLFNIHELWISGERTDYQTNERLQLFTPDSHMHTQDTHLSFQDMGFLYVHTCDTVTMGFFLRVSHQNSCLYFYLCEDSSPYTNPIQRSALKPSQQTDQ